MDKPTWVDSILRDTQAYQSFMAYVDQNETRILTEMRDCIQDNKLDAARVLAGESQAWKSIRHQIRMYEREEEQHGIIQSER